MADPDSTRPEALQDGYRYVIVVIGFATLAGVSGVSHSFAVFYATLIKVFDWSHAAGASVYSVNMLVVAVSAPLIGWLLDRFGPRLLYTTAAVVIGLAFLACSRLRSLGEFALFYGVLSALGQTALLSMTVVVARWFPKAQQGRAIGLADVGTGFGMLVFAPGSAWLMTWLGWRQAFVVLAVVVMGVLVPLNLLHRPVPSGVEPSSQPLSLTGVLGSRALWILCTAHLFMTMVNVHLIAFLVEAGILALVNASFIAGALSLVSLPGRMWFGWLADRLQPHVAFTTAMSCTMSGFLMLLLLAQWPIRWPLVAFVLIYGFAQGAGGIAVSAQTVALFRGPYLGRIFMIVTLSGNLGAAFGGWFGGRLFDLSGSYTLTFFTAILSGMCAISCMWASGVRRHPESRVAGDAAGRVAAVDPGVVDPPAG